MTEIERKIEQCKKDIWSVQQNEVQCKRDIVTLQNNLTKLEVEKAQTKLVPGDVIVSSKGDQRLIVASEGGKVFSVGADGCFLIYEDEFQYWDYKKIGYISDFIKDRQ